MNNTVDTVAGLRRIYLRNDGILIREEILSLLGSTALQKEELEETMTSIQNDMCLNAPFALTLKEVNRFLTLKKAIDSKKESTVCKAVAAQLQVLDESLSNHFAKCEEALEAASSIPNLISSFSEKLPKLVKALSEYARMCEDYFINTESAERLRANIYLLPLAQKAHEIVEKNAALLTIDVYWLVAESLYKDAQSMFEGNLYYFGIVRDFLNTAIIEQGLEVPRVSIPEKFTLPAVLAEEVKEEEAVEEVPEKTITEEVEEETVVEEEVKEVITEEVEEVTVVEEEVKEVIAEEVEEATVVEEEVKEVIAEEVKEEAVAEEEIKEVIAEEAKEEAAAEEEIKEVIAEEVKEEAAAEEEIKEVIAEEVKEATVVEEEVKKAIAEEVKEVKVVEEEVKKAIAEEVKEVKVVEEEVVPPSNQEVPKTLSTDSPTSSASPVKPSPKKYILFGAAGLIIAVAVVLFFLLNHNKPQEETPNIIKVETAVPTTSPEATTQEEPTPSTPKAEQETPKNTPKETSEKKVEEKSIEKPVEKKSKEESVSATEKDKSSTSFDATMKRAKAGNADAQYRIGQYYESGNGVTADTFEALTWYRKAKANGSKEAEKRLAELGY